MATMKSVCVCVCTGSGRWASVGLLGHTEEGQHGLRPEAALHRVRGHAGGHHGRVHPLSPQTQICEGGLSGYVRLGPDPAQARARPTDAGVDLSGCDTFEQLLKTFQLCRAMLGEILSAYEFLDSECMRLLNTHLQLSNPIRGMHAHTHTHTQ